MKIILASKSPRRQELIKGLELNFSIVTYEVDEDFDASDLPSDIARKLAVKKAHHFPNTLIDDEVLLTADTIVWINGKVLNKPANEQESFEMLSTICGATHQVFTGVCLKTIDKEISFSEMSSVTCKKLSDEEIYHYIRNYKPFDKAGSYGIQDWFGYTAVEKIDGCFYNVMGLPVSRIYEELKKIKKK
ncbi:MAG: Maf family nucleotide pyrophosphatase [Bacteroidia bacterium]|nr:Maf family nucleotide pyrophosphatase [Bacteroidia bacterium]MCF8425923.1 Maf family nucleotide pyrophosphatase [Bacteroidia bacterium]MCF8447399.1 Maf family nucleotide pyrophosphatase [Bacteroidia bacterium]